MEPTRMHEFIRDHREEILSRSLQDLQERYPDRSEDDLFDSVPAFLDEVTDALRADDGAVVPGAIRGTLGASRAAKHGLVRKNQGFDIGRVIKDYGLLCDKINELAVERQTVFDSRDHQILNRCIDEGTALAVEAFAAQREGVESEELALIVHEIRNAAWSAAVSFELISRGQVASSGRTAEVLKRSLHRIGALARDALTQARLNAGTTAQHEPVRLGEIFAQIVAGAFPERDIQIRTEIEQDLEIEADPQLLASAVSNLIQNAIKFTQTGQTIHVRARLVDGAVNIEVEDRCGGLPPGAVEDLFRPFVRRSTGTRGAGLGLAIARRAVEAHGGTLTVRNLPGLGCVFAVLIPRSTRSLD